MPCQAEDVDACGSFSGNTLEISKEMPCQAEDVDACGSFSGNTLEISKEMPCQAEDVDACGSFSGNTLEDCDHDVIPVEMSSLEKCVTCGGPFSPLKWSGVRCKVCNQSWHKKCYIKHNVDVTELLQVVCTEQSSSEVASSEEEYVPDSIDDSNSSWDDRSEPLEISHKQVQNCEVSTSKSASKKKRHHQGSFVQEDRESISKDAESVPEDMISTTQLEVSRVTAKVGNADAEGIMVDDGADATAENVSNTSALLRNRTYCYICGKIQTKFTRHLKTHEKTHADVAQVLSLPKRSKKRMKMLLKLRNKGNHSHNSEVLVSGVGSLKLRRTSKKKYNAKDYIHCIYCQALYLRRDLWRHVRQCSSKPVEATSETGRNKVLSLASMNESSLCQQISPGVWNILAVMKDDETTSTVRSDFSILQLAQSFFNKYGQDPTKHQYIRQQLRETGRLLLTLRKEFSIHTLEDAVRPANFDVVIKSGQESIWV
ncbi:uncharacterized protein LOC124465456 [Hypomesus transpacificus]|uniref:uncharacterized protein LOC124465456 n=1 Tax=Hypomesus transpacificus TaxID=137520 RepID=UPI001F07E077|nr:uncharacterized protein LOC124465456 [Hypomesus transpacificus]